MKLLSLTLLSLIFLTACDPRSSLMPGVDSWFSPTPPFMRNIPDGNDSYSVGFRNGCDTYISIVGTGLMQAKGYDADNNRLLTDSMYSKGFLDGRAYCTQFLDPAIN